MGTSTIKLKHSILNQAGLSEGQVRRAARELVEVGLIRTSSGPGKRREITLLDKEYLTWLRADAGGDS